ncbi:uncharacterized protein VTP21DRAFT_4311 [Calcarisporiella thermophila]|uniref:uncharacterized protein n=1 Tax=Calcarisporiella thermophila TaxID=911321 RepID=UPI003742B971
MPNLLGCKKCYRSDDGGSGFTLPDAKRHYAPDTVVEPVHMDIQLRFDDLDSNALTGVVNYTVRGRAGGSRLTLNAVALEDVRVEGEGLAFFNYDGKHIQMEWETPFSEGEQRLIVVWYSVDHPVSGLYFARSEHTNTGAQFVVSDHETERARYWLPCVDYPVVRTTLTFTIVHPASTLALANGQLEGVTSDSVGMQTTRWRLDFPCPSYLLCIAVGEFEEVDDGDVDGIPVKYYAAKGTPHEDMRRTFGKTPDMMRWLAAKLGAKVPWPKYYQIALPVLWGAMECISLVTWTSKFLLDPRYAAERGFEVDTINLHEMAHSYFGNMTVIRHFEHAWLKESWATYMEVCYIADHYDNGEDGEETAFYLMRHAGYYFDECKQYTRPIVTNSYDHSFRLFDEHLYPGGGWRLHMLRHLIGDDAFWKGVRSYLDEHRFKVVTTEAFKGHLEQASGKNLTRFFDEWVYSPGYPSLRIHYELLEKVGVQVVMEQTQTGGNVFHFDLEVEVEDSNGHTHSAVARFETNRAVVLIPLPEAVKPTQFRVDPRGKILFGLEGVNGVSEEIWEETACKSKDVWNRVRAFGQLVNIGSRSALKKVRELVEKESFYGVRIRVAEFLSASKSAFGLEILAEMLERERNPLALLPIVMACNMRDERIRQALLKFLQRPELPYRAHGAALQSLALQQHPDDLELLMRVAKDESLWGQHGLVRFGALRALGIYRSPEVLPYLLSCCRHEPAFTRPALPTAIAASASHLEKRLQHEAVDLLTEMLRDPIINVRISAVDALVSLGATQHADDVQAVQATLPEQERPWLERRLRELHAAAGAAEEGKLGNVKKRLEELEGKVRELEGKLMKFEAQEKVKGEKGIEPRKAEL